MDVVEGTLTSWEDVHKNYKLNPGGIAFCCATDLLL